MTTRGEIEKQKTRREEAEEQKITDKITSGTARMRNPIRYKITAKFYTKITEIFRKVSNFQ